MSVAAPLASTSDAVPLTTALREWFPRGRSGNPVHLSTAMRWINRGVLAANGERVFLRAVRIGGTTYLRPADAERFILALNADTPVADDHAETEMLRRSREAGEALKAMGS